VESSSEECQINTVVVTNEITKGKWNTDGNCYTHCSLKFPCFINKYTLSTLCANSGKLADVLSVSSYDNARTNLCSSRACVRVYIYIYIYIYTHVYAPYTYLLKYVDAKFLSYTQTEDHIRF
jgi:hypothetical protein